MEEEKAHIVQVVEALLMSADHPLTTKEICDVLGGDASSSEVENAINELNRFYQETERTFCIRNIAKGWRIFVKPEFSPWIRKLYASYRQERLSRAALETLAIIAYKQPITKVEVEQIRGVACDGVIKGLFEKGLIRIEGRKDVPGRPFLYVTTDLFLDYFGLSSLKDLPRLEEFDRVISEISQKEVDLGLGEVAVANRETGRTDSRPPQSSSEVESEDR